MKKLILAPLLLTAFALYGQVSPYIDTMLPRSRQTLSSEMIESADAYEAVGNKKRALEYRRAALDVYPMGDNAHILARSLNTPLDDEKTYSNFVLRADKAYSNRSYAVAAANYLMALELRQPVDIYEKLQQSYLNLGSKKEAEALQVMIDGAKNPPEQPVSVEDGYTAEYSEGYTEAVEMDQSFPEYEPDEDEYPQSYPLDGYGDAELL